MLNELQNSSLLCTYVLYNLKALKLGWKPNDSKQLSLLTMK